MRNTRIHMRYRNGMRAGEWSVCLGFSNQEHNQGSDLWWGCKVDAVARERWPVMPIDYLALGTNDLIPARYDELPRSFRDRRSLENSNNKAKTSPSLANVQALHSLPETSFGDDLPSLLSSRNDGGRSQVRSTCNNITDRQSADSGFLKCSLSQELSGVASIEPSFRL